MSTPSPLVPPDGSVLGTYDLASMAGSAEIVPSVCGLLYPGAVHSVAGEPAHGKTWFALGLLASVVQGGRLGTLIDFEDGPHTARYRMRSLGVDRESLGPPFYQRPLGPLAEDDPGLSWLVDLVASLEIALVVIDSVPEALAGCGLDENSSRDVTRWFQMIRPLARAGAAVLVIDHVTKATGDRGRWARGSGAKLAAIDGVAYTLETVEPFSRHRSGNGQLRISKDRHGAVGGNGEIVRTVRFDVAGGSLYRVRLERWGGSTLEPDPDDGHADDPEDDVAQAGLL